MANYNSPFVKKVWFYSQKVLPLVFDNSLSYYEALAHFAHKVNEIINTVNNQTMHMTEWEKEIALAMEVFEQELRQIQADFEERMEGKWSDFKAEMLAWKQDIDEDWTVMQSEFSALENLIQQQIENLDADYTQYKADLTAQQSAFETAQTARQSNFETAQTNRQAAFEQAQTTRQTDFETSMTNDWTEFQTEIETEVASGATKNNISYYGALRPVSAGSSTDWPFIDNPIDSVQGLNFANNVVSVYTHNATAHNYKFLKRQKFGALSTDGDIPTPSRSAPVLIVFDNPVANLFFAYGADLTFTGSGVDGSGDNRLIIGAFPRVSDVMSFTDPGYTALAEYTAHGITDHTLTPRSTAYPVQPSYYAIAFLFSGVNYSVTLTQPSTAATQRRIMPGLLYDAFTGEFMRDPALADFVANVLPYVLQRGEYTLNDQSALTFDTLSETKYYRYTASAIGNPVPGGYGIIVNIRFTAYAVQLVFSQTTTNAPTQLLYRLGTDMNTTPNWKPWRTVGSNVKTLTYTGTGSNPTVITFPDTPTVILSIDGAGLGTGMITLGSFRYGATCAPGTWVDPVLDSSGAYGLRSTAEGNILRLFDGLNEGARANVTDAEYKVIYI
jgi:hypothetical protein